MHTKQIKTKCIKEGGGHAGARTLAVRFVAKTWGWKLYVLVTFNRKWENKDKSGFELGPSES